MQQFYKDLIRLKKENKALWNGEHGGTIKFFDVYNDNVLAFVRQRDKNKVIVVANLSKDNVKITAPFNEYAGKYKDFMTNKKKKIQKSQQFELKPWEYMILIK